MHKIEKITTKELDKLLNSSTVGKDNYRPLGLFYNDENKIVIGVDNSSGSAYVEEFKSVNKCKSWLKGEFEINN